MKFCVQLNPQVSIDKPGALLMPTWIEQVRVAVVFYMLPRFDWTPGLPQDEILASMRLSGENVIQKL